MRMITTNNNTTELQKPVWRIRIKLSYTDSDPIILQQGNEAVLYLVDSGIWNHFGAGSDTQQFHILPVSYHKIV